MQDSSDCSIVKIFFGLRTIADPMAWQAVLWVGIEAEEEVR